MRRTRSRGVWPVLTSIAVWAAGVGAWKAFAEPRFPPNLDHIAWTRGVYQPVPKGFSPIYRIGTIRSGGLVVAGDSRVQSGIDPEILDDAGLGPTALLTGPSGQLRDLLRIVRDAPARRLVLALSPLSVAAFQNLRRQIKILEEPWTRAKVDDWLDTWLGDQQRRLVDTLSPARWSRSWLPPFDPEEQVEGYSTRLPKIPDAQRLKRLADAKVLLRALSKGGWTIACVRIPTNPGVRAAEDAAWPPERFVEFCDDLGIPYLDLGRDAPDILSVDGSHLLAREGRAVTREIAQWLSGLPGFAR